MLVCKNYALPSLTREELETAETLITLHEGGIFADLESMALPFLTFKDRSVSEDADAMEKVTGRYDVNKYGRPLQSDAMDQILGISDLVLPVRGTLNVEMDPNAK